jgi:hypothetical protein
MQRENEYAVQSYADKYPIIYNHPEKEFVIRLGDANDKGYKDYIMCEVPKSVVGERLKEENNLILQVTDHACKRDEQGLVASTNIIINEIEAITNLNVSMPEEIQTMDHFFPKIVANYDLTKIKRRKGKSDQQEENFLALTAFDQLSSRPSKLKRRRRNGSSNKWKKKSDTTKLDRFSSACTIRTE